MHRWGIIAVLFLTLLMVAGALWFSFGPRSSSPAVLPASKSPAEPVPVQQPVSSGVALRAWIFNGSVPAASWEHIASQFQKSSGLEVELTTFESEDKYRAALRQAMLSHTLPDVFLIESVEAEAFRQAGHLALLDPESSDSTRWLPGALACFQREKKWLAIPSDFTLLALYYNCASFDRVGVAYPDVHWNWTILLSMSQAIYQAAEDGQPAVFAIELPIGFDLWEAFSMQAGAGLYNGSAWLAGDSKVSGPQIKALTYLRDFIRKYVIVSRPLSARPGMNFLEGKSGMVVAGTELLPQLRGRKGFRWGVAPLPKDENRATVMEARGWAVSSLATNLQGAARLARAFASQSSRSDWLPADLSGQAAFTGPEKVFYDSAAYAQPPPVMVTAPEMKRLISEEMLRWINQYNPSPEAMADWAHKMFPQ